MMTITSETREKPVARASPGASPAAIRSLLTDPYTAAATEVKTAAPT